MDKAHPQKGGLSNRKKSQTNRDISNPNKNVDLSSPLLFTPENVLALQSLIGNRATLQLLRKRQVKMKALPNRIMRQAQANTGQTVKWAIMLYINSSVAKTPMGSKVLVKLVNLVGKNEIAIETLAPNRGGEQRGPIPKSF